MSKGSMKEMAELLRNGARMLSESCPQCSTPLFRLQSGEVICPRCQKTLKIISGDTEEQDKSRQGSLEETLRKKISEVQGLLVEEKDPLKMRNLTETLIVMLNALDKVKKIS
jgi:UPF0148 protein